MIVLTIILIALAYYLGAKYGLPTFLNSKSLEERMDILSMFQKGDIISAYDFNYGYYANDDGSWIKDYEVINNHPELKQITLKETGYYKKESRTYSYKNPRFRGVETRSVHVILNRLK